MGTFLPHSWAVGIQAAPPTRLKQLWLLQSGFGSARVQLAASKVCFSVAVEDHLTYRQPSASVSLELGFVFKT